MNDNFISQEELDALLGNLGVDTLNNKEAKAQNVADIILNSGAKALSDILGRKVDVLTFEVQIKKISEIRKEVSDEKVLVSVNFKGIVEGLICILMEKLTAAQFADLMMGGTGKTADTTLDEVKLSAAGEVMNQMISSISTSLADMIKKAVNITPPEIKMVDFSDPSAVFPPLAGDNEDVAKVNFTFDIEEVGKAVFSMIMPTGFVKSLYDLINPQNQVQPAQTKASSNATNVGKPSAMQGSAPSKKEGPVNVKPAKFEDFGQIQQPQEQKKFMDERLQLLFDVPLTVVVELGKTKMTLKQIIELGVGSLVELDKLMGEPVDILVNNKLIARGEVVVIDENFGVRITEIVSPQERFYNINK